MRFSKIVGQDQPVQLLQRSLAKGRLSHAYLLTGPSHDTLQEIARALTQTLLCAQPVRAAESGLPIDACDECLPCRKVREEIHPDVQWIRPESKSRIITIDQIRELMRTIYLKPHESGYKVAIIAAADRLNVQAANAFLKTLEEPPPFSLLILTSTEPQLILETILSRCLRLNAAGEHTGRIQELHEEWLGRFSTLAAGQQKGILGRYHLLGILLEELGKAKSETERDLTARSPLQRYTDADPKLADKWETELSAAIEAEYRRQRSERLLALQWWLRDVWLQTLRLGQDLLTFPKMAAASEAVARRLSGQDAMENLAVIDDTQRLLASNAQEALALEVGLLKLKL